jgi:TraG P-loop domain
MGFLLIKRNDNGHRKGCGKNRRELVRAAGELLPIVALDADGTVVLEDGSLVHVVACAPPNQESMDSEQIEQAFWGFRALAAALGRGQVLQMLIEGDLLETGEHLDFYRRQLKASHGFDPAALCEREAVRLPEEQRARWALYRMLGESVHRSAPDGLTMRRRCYLVVRYRPEFDLDPSLADALPAWLPGSRARRLGELESVRRVRERRLREHRRVVRRALNRVRGFVHHLARDDIQGRVLNGAEVLRYLVSRCNPTSATWGRLEESAAWDGVLSRFDSPVEREQAKRAAGALREQVARSPLDFRRSVHHGEVEQDLVRTGYLGGSPSSTRMFWLQELLHQPLPFTLTVFLHGLARAQVQDEMTRAWHQAQRENERRLGRGRRDAEAERQEREQELLVEEMANDPQAGLVELSLYLLLRAPGPRPDANGLNELEEAAHQAGQVVHRATAGGVLMPGTREQDVLWRSTLPLGIDVAHKTLRFGMEHAADTTALIGASCGSPQGLPLLVSPTGEIEYLNPFDRAHRNHSIVVAGMSGTGKTHFGNRVVAHLVALGARGYVFDRSGHYEILGRLIPGARKLDVGSEESRHAINHWDTPDPWNPPKQKVRFLVDLHRVMLEIDLTRMQEALLAHCIRSTYRHCAGNGLVPRERELVAFMRAFAEHERQLRGSDDQSVRAIDALAGELAEFVESGIYAHLWDRETNIPDDAPLLIFDSSGAGERMLIPLVFATMDWVRDRVQRANREAAASPVEGARLHGRSVVLLDEGWSWSQVEELAQHIQHWARQSRHYGACFVVMSQDAKDFEGTAEAVLRNASIKLLLEQDKAMLDYLEQTVNVSPEVVRRLKDLRTVKGQYSEALLVNGARGTGRVRLVVGAHEYWAFTSEPNYDRPRRERAITARDGNVWAGITELATEEGIPDADAGVAA